MELTTEQKEQLKEIVEGRAFELYSDKIDAVDGLKEISKSVKEMYGISPKYFNKMVKLYTEAKYDEMKAENEDFNRLYEEVIK